MEASVFSFITLSLEFIYFMPIGETNQTKLFMMDKATLVLQYK